jgi:hypothetical protein
MLVFFGLGVVGDRPTSFRLNSHKSDRRLSLELSPLTPLPRHIVGGGVVSNRRDEQGKGIFKATLDML